MVERSERGDIAVLLLLMGGMNTRPQTDGVNTAFFRISREQLLTHLMVQEQSLIASEHLGFENHSDDLKQERPETSNDQKPSTTRVLWSLATLNDSGVDLRLKT